MATTPLGVSLLVLLAAALLVAGAVGSLLPVAPGGVLSLAGVAVYWWSTGFAGGDLPLVVAGALLALTAMAVDLFGGAAAATAAGTTGRTAAIAGLVGLLLLPVTGPLGILAGVAATVYVAERRRGTVRRESARVAGKTLVGMLLANGVQFLLTGTVLAGFLVVVLL